MSWPARPQGAVARATFLRNLEWAAAQRPEQSLTIEPINAIDMPGYFLRRLRSGRAR